MSNIPSGASNLNANATSAIVCCLMLPDAPYVVLGNCDLPGTSCFVWGP